MTSAAPISLTEHQRRSNEAMRARLLPLPPSLTAPVPDGFEPAGDAAPMLELHIPFPVRYWTQTSPEAVPGRISVRRTTLTRAAEPLPLDAKIKVTDRGELVDRYAIAAGIVSGDVNGVVSFYRQAGQRIEPLPLDGVWTHLAELQAQFGVTDADVETFGKDAVTMKGLKASAIVLTVVAFAGLSAREKLGRLKAATKALDLKPNEANGPLGIELYGEVVTEAIKKAKGPLELRDLLDRLLE